LFAPLPSDAVPRRQPVAPPEILARPEGAAVAGWQQLVLHLSEVPTGSRTILVLLDADGRPISASDGVLYRIEQPDGMVRFEMESVGGRLEPDGRFLGTRWRNVSLQRENEDDATPLEATPSTPSDEDVVAIKALVAELVRRAS
jgi:hypothetical protein